MNTASLKAYAPKARNDFIEAVSRQAAKYGFTANHTEPLTIKGDVALIGDQAFPKSIETQRESLHREIKQRGYHVVIEQVAYSWFNRFCAIRFMELHDYLGHGRRVLSHPDHVDSFQLLDECLDVALPGLDQPRVRELKLDGTQDETLYRELLLAQCHALHQSMPFLFEPVDDETELLLPTNLTKTDSLIKELVNAIPEEDWENIEIIGWLYQFYISEKKDQVIGKVVASEDIPAATQLFTPNWIVKYMVQNSLGAQWLATYPGSKLKEQMEYYIEPAEQTDEVNAQLASITPVQLNPEELTLIDPACGSGHILTEAYELFKAIYLERGYRQRDIPQLILEKNLFGLDIDERAAQLTGFALMMKGRADDRRLFERGVKLNVMALVDSAGFDAEGLANGVELSAYGLKPRDLAELKRLFEHATTFGSLIQVPEELASSLQALKQLSVANSRDLFVADTLKRLRPLVLQTELLAAQYDAVAANPPYMGSSGMNTLMKEFAKENFPAAKSDLFACFMERALHLVADNCRYSLITMPSWLFLGSFEKLREKLLDASTVVSLLHMGRGIFGIDFGSTAFAIQKVAIPEFMGRYFRPHQRNFQHIHIPDIASLFRNALRDPAFKYDFDCYRGLETGTEISSEPMPDGDQIHFLTRQSEFKKIPGSPLAYWVSPAVIDCFEAPDLLASRAKICEGMNTANNDLFLRRWHEVPRAETCFDGGTTRFEAKWFPYEKGGDFRKWSGNLNHVVNWRSDGQDIKSIKTAGGATRANIRNEDYFFLPAITWSYISSVHFGVRERPGGAIFDGKGPSLFSSDSERDHHLAMLCSKPASVFMKFLNPTVNFSVGSVSSLPLPREWPQRSKNIAQVCRDLAKSDWNTYERSWDFQVLPFLPASYDPTPTLESSYTAWSTQNRATIAEMKSLEEENNRLFIDAYGLAEELTPDVPIEQITLTVNPAYRYGGKLTQEELWARFRQDTMEELVSYVIGCMMGRYSLDTPGLVYAHNGNEGFDSSRYPTFRADDDGIVPLTGTDWFDDDACNRVIEFISKAWDASHLEGNLTFLADNLSPKKNESNRETIRRYLNDSFFKDHLQTYKKRPIYWLFSSGKEKAFQCLVYLHRYNEGTLARMRTEYVIPLTAKLASHVTKLEQDRDASSTTAEIKRLEKDIARIHKQQAELSTFDEKLRHFADQRISLDLDDGVKVNYGKFGDLLAEVKAIHGKKPEVI